MGPRVTSTCLVSFVLLLVHQRSTIIIKTRKNDIVDNLDYQVPATQLMGPKRNGDMQAAKRE